MREPARAGRRHDAELAGLAADGVADLGALANQQVAAV